MVQFSQLPNKSAVSLRYGRVTYATLAKLNISSSAKICVVVTERSHGKTATGISFQVLSADVYVEVLLLKEQELNLRIRFHGSVR